MEETSFSVKAQSKDEYKNRLVEMEKLLNIWVDKQEGREYLIEENKEDLNFNIKAKRYGKN